MGRLLLRNYFLQYIRIYEIFYSWKIFTILDLVACDHTFTNIILDLLNCDQTFTNHTWNQGAVFHRSTHALTRTTRQKQTELLTLVSHHLALRHSYLSSIHGSEITIFYDTTSSIPSITFSIDVFTCLALSFNSSLFGDFFRRAHVHWVMISAPGGGYMSLS